MNTYLCVGLRAHRVISKLTFYLNDLLLCHSNKSTILKE